MAPDDRDYPRGLDLPGKDLSAADKEEIYRWLVRVGDLPSWRDRPEAGRLIRAARQITGSLDAAEQVVADKIADILTTSLSRNWQPGPGNNGGRFRNYVLEAVRRAAISTLRRTAREQQAMQEFRLTKLEMIPPEVAAMRPSCPWIVLAAARHIEAQFERLPECPRQAIALYYSILQRNPEFSYSQIVQEAVKKRRDWTANQFKVYVSRAVQHVRKLITIDLWGTLLRVPLTSTERTALQLVDISGLSVAKAAQELGLSKAAMEETLERARRLVLRSLLNDNEEGPRDGERPQSTPQ